MTGNLYSVEQVADRLDLHVKTVRSYVRSGRLKATRIGKQYRIAREDLEAMTGKPATSVDGAAISKQRHVEVSSIVEIEAISPESVSRVTNMLLAATSTRSQEGGKYVWRQSMTSVEGGSKSLSSEVWSRLRSFLD